jgi:hypothetical protein
MGEGGLDMRDLKSDLEFWQACKGLQAETAYVTPFIDVINDIVPEAIERAIEAESFIEEQHLGLTYQKLCALQDSVRCCRNCDAKVSNHNTQVNMQLHQDNAALGDRP